MELTVRGRIALLLCFTVLFAPALRLMAEGQAAPAPASATASSATAAEAAVADNAAASPVSGSAALSPTAQAPALPDEAADATAVASPSGDATEGPSALPKDKVVVPGPAKPVEAPSRYRASNFVLGFVGGALLCGLGGFLIGTNGPHGIDWAKARVIPVVSAAAGGVLGGFGSLWLGAYSPEEARPPEVEGRLPALGMQASLHF
jgi:hypothetical protein